MNKKIMITMVLFVAIILGQTTSVSAIEERGERLTDDEIREVLNVYHSVYNGSADDADYYSANQDYISEKDIEEFKKMAYSPLTRSSSYNTYFNSTSWINRSGVISLSINFKISGLYPSNLPNANAAAAEKAWKILYNRHKNDSKWKNTKSMYVQFICHSSMVGKYKNPWNIEPHRTETSMVKTIAKGCNP